MSNFTNQRRAPNVSQYLANLNQIPTQQELQQQSDLSGFDADLDFLTNTEFFDFDQFHPSTGFADQPHHRQAQPKPAQFQFGEFQAFNANTSLSPSDSAASPANLHGRYPPQAQHFAADSPATGDKRKASVAMPASAADLEEASRMAAEEDKRRRNTAASARFRVKKKQREQALEKQAKEMSDKVQALESKIQQLETENKWLKELITEKSDVKTLETALDLKREKESEERSTESRTDGVGTDASKGQEGEA